MKTSMWLKCNASMLRTVCGWGISSPWLRDSWGFSASKSIYKQEAECFLPLPCHLCPSRWGFFQLGPGLRFPFLPSLWLLAHGIQTHLTFLATTGKQSENKPGFLLKDLSTRHPYLQHYIPETLTQSSTRDRWHCTGNACLQSISALSPYLHQSLYGSSRVPGGLGLLAGRAATTSSLLGANGRKRNISQDFGSQKGFWKRNKLLLVSVPVQWHLSVESFLHPSPVTRVETSVIPCGFGLSHPNVLWALSPCQDPIIIIISFNNINLCEVVVTILMLQMK